MKKLLLTFVAICCISTANARYYGDINNDASVNISDVSALVDLLYNTNSSFDTTAADVNRDGSVNDADVTELVNIVLGKRAKEKIEESTTIDYDNWMSKLDDNWFLARLSIPGTHNACTSGLSGASKTQSYDIDGQLSRGVRMFDLRPRVNSSTMYIYHGILSTGKKFDDVLSTLCTFLDNHPQEFLFVIMRHENDGASDTEKSQWPAMMYECLNKKKDYIIDYSPTLTVKEMRGKILVMSRDTYDNGPIGAYIMGDGDNSVYDRNIYGTSGTTMGTTTQDMYDVAGSGELDSKVTAIQTLLGRSIGESEYRLFFNHTSGYSQKIFGISTSSGVQTCAKTCNAAVINYMDGKVGPMGFIMMDFAGDETYQGQTLIDLIINNNYALKNQELDDAGHVKKGDKIYVLPMGADKAWEAKYIRKDASESTTSAVDALTDPSTSWKNTYFSDTSWDTMQMPLASAGYGAPYRTTWTGEYNCYWIRRAFSLDEVNATSKYTLICYHDDDYAIYVNGNLINQADGWTDPGSPVTFEIDKSYLKVGKNVIAIKQQQNWGGAYCDCGIYEEKNQYSGIQAVQTVKGTDGKIYNLQGIEVEEPTQPGLYIKNGKAVIMK